MSNLSRDELNALNELVQVGDGYGPTERISGPITDKLKELGLIDSLDIAVPHGRPMIVQLTALGRRTILAMG